MARKTKEEAEQTRLNLLKASLVVFYEQGYSGATFNGIASRVGLTRGAVHWHFKSKEELFISLGTYMFERLDRTIHQTYERAETFEELKITARNTVRSIIEDPELKKYFTLILYRMEWNDELLPVKEMFEEQDLEYKKYTQHVFECQQARGNIGCKLPIEQVTYLWMGFINGFLSRHLKRDDAVEAILHEFDLGADIFIAGIQTL